MLQRLGLYYNDPSALVLLAILGVIVLNPLVLGLQNPFMWDLFGYFLYLPLTVVYDDLGMRLPETLEYIKNQHFISDTLYQIYQAPKGGWMTRYPIGLALISLPFYLLGHLVAMVTDFEVDGLSLPYQYSIYVSGFFYFMVGLTALRRLLLKFFFKRITAIVLVITFLGTNLISQAIGASPGAHIFLFGIFGLILYYSDKLYSENRGRYLIILGVLVAFAAICRPTNVLVGLIPLFWNVRSWCDLKKRLRLVFVEWKKPFAYAVIVAFVVVSVQMIYWYEFTGRFIYNSYNNVGEGLDWFQPHTWNALFSFRNGWFVYTPLALVAIVALFFIKHPFLQRQRICFLVFILLNIYVVSSWTCWWYGGGFGHRAFVESYAVLVFPLAALISSALNWKPLLKWSVFVGLAVILALNVFQFKQFLLRIIPVDRMSGAYYKAVFLSLDEQLKAENEHLLLYDTRLPFEESMEKYPFKSDIVQRITGSFDTLHGEKPFSKAIEFPYSQLPEADATWLSMAMDVPAETACNWIWVTTMFRENENYGYKAFDMCQEVPVAEDSLGGKVTYQLHYLLPHVRHNSDRLKMYMWNANNLSDTVVVSDLAITAHSLINYP